jgi:hypothetical protein
VDRDAGEVDEAGDSLLQLGSAIYHPQRPSEQIDLGLFRKLHLGRRSAVVEVSVVVLLVVAVSL